MAKVSEDEFPLASYTDKLAERLRELVPAALRDGDVDAVHQARVTTRRLRAALNLLDSVIPTKASKPVAKSLRRLRRQLGPLRDADVMLGHLADLKRYPKHLPAVEWLETHLQAEREEAANTAMTEAPPAKTLAKLGAWWGVRDQMESACETVDTLLAHSLHSQLDEFASAADSLGQNGETPPNPHALRIAGKLLRYTVEMAEVEGHALPPEVLKTFKKMQGALGMWHDFVVLVETAMQISVDQILPAADAAMQGKILRLIDLCLRRAQSYLAKFVRLWDERGAEISAAIRAAFPDPREINESKTDHDPDGLIEPQAPAV